MIKDNDSMVTEGRRGVRFEKLILFSVIFADTHFTCPLSTATFEGIC